MTTNVSVTKSQTENSASLIRRFTKRMRESGVLMRARSQRYHKRQPSRYLRKQKALKSIAKREHYAELYKLGKITEQKRTRFRR